MLDKLDHTLHGAQNVVMAALAGMMANLPAADDLYHYFMETAAAVLIMMQIAISYRHLRGKSRVAPELPEVPK